MADATVLAERKRTLLELLRLRYHPLPAGVGRAVQASQDPEQLADPNYVQERLEAVKASRLRRAGATP